MYVESLMIFFVHIVIIYAFRTEPGCSVKGQGGLKTSLKLDLTRPQGSEGSCGVKYNPVSKTTEEITQLELNPLPPPPHTSFLY
jgi:hypothetical protein